MVDQDAAKVDLYNELKDHPKVKNKRRSIEHGGMNGGVNQKTLNAKYKEQNYQSLKLDDS